jgi:RecA-family ATPase
LVEEFQMGSVGPDESEPVFIPNQSPPVDDQLINKAKFSKEVGNRKTMSFTEVLDDDEKLKFIIQDLLPDTGQMYLGGLSGTGKTILATQMIVDIVLGRPTMTWKLGDAWHDQMRVGMLSLEMGKKQLQRRLQDMYPSLTDDERKVLDERFTIYCEPEPFKLWDAVHAAELARLVKTNELDVLLIDSASVSFAASLKDDAQVNESTNNLYIIRNRLNVATIIVAHTRKPPAGIASNPEDITLNELFGHSGVAQTGDAIIIMLEDEKHRKATIKNGDEKKAEKLVHIINAKSRFGANAGAFKAYLTSKDEVEKGQPLMFKRNAIPIAMTDEARRKANKTPGTDLKSTLSGIDFTAIMDGDDE